ERGEDREAVDSGHVLEGLLRDCPSAAAPSTLMRRVSRYSPVRSALSLSVLSKAKVKPTPSGVGAGAGGVCARPAGLNNAVAQAIAAVNTTATKRVQELDRRI